MRHLLPCLFCLLALLVALLPYAVQGTAAHVTAHDHLDANFAWAVVLAREGHIFSDPHSVVMPFLGGLERHYLGSPYQIYFWLFGVLPPFGALVAGELLTRIIAFWGAYALVSETVASQPGKRDDVLLSSLIAAGFALLPFWPPGGSAVAGVPMFLWAAIRLRRAWPTPAEAVGMVSCIFLFVFYGSLVLSGVFALVLTSGLILVDAVRRQFASVLRLMLFNGATSVLFLWQDRWLFDLSLSLNDTMRVERRLEAMPTAKLLETIRQNFLEGQYHADPGTAWPVFVAICLALAVALVTPARRGMACVVLLASLFALGMTAVLFGLHRWDVIQSMLPGLKGFNFGRFHWLQPGLWLLAFGAALFLLRDALPWRQAGWVLALVLAPAQVFQTAARLPVFSNETSRIMSYDGFFAPAMFRDIRKMVEGSAKPVRLGMVGMHPAIAQVNGFDTVGGYLQLYPLDTKHRFRRIISEELEKADSLRRYFDAWGNRAYLFAAELEHCKGACFSTVAPEMIAADFDISEFRAFGGTHIASTSAIKDAEAQGLRHMGVVNSDTPAGMRGWRLHLYDASGG